MRLGGVSATPHIFYQFVPGTLYKTPPMVTGTGPALTASAPMSPTVQPPPGALMSAGPPARIVQVNGFVALKVEAKTAPEPVAPDRVVAVLFPVLVVVPVLVIRAAQVVVVPKVPEVPTVFNALHIELKLFKFSSL